MTILVEPELGLGGGGGGGGGGELDEAGSILIVESMAFSTLASMVILIEPEEVAWIASFPSNTTMYSVSAPSSRIYIQIILYHLVLDQNLLNPLSVFTVWFPDFSHTQLHSVLLVWGEAADDVRKLGPRSVSLKVLFDPSC